MLKWRRRLLLWVSILPHKYHKSYSQTFGVFESVDNLEEIGTDSTRLNCIRIFIPLTKFTKM